MFRSVQQRDSKSAATMVDIAPLIDVVFILLIFFLVTATFVRDTGVDVVRPQATQTRSLEPSAMRVSITASGDIYTEGRRVTADELQARVQSFIAEQNKRSVIVIPDAEVTAGTLIEVMDAARRGGATDVALATKKIGAN